MKKIISVIGKILILLSFIYIINNLWKYRAELTEVFNTKFVLYFFVFTVLYSLLVYYFSPITFFKLLHLFSEKTIKYSKLKYTYCKCNLYKYLPGNIWHYVGRNQLAVDNSFSHKTVALSSVTEIGLTVLSAIFIITVSSAKASILWLQQNIFKNNSTVFIIALIIICIIIGLLLITLPPVKKFFKPYSLLLTQKGIEVFCKLLLLNIFIMFASCSIFVNIELALGVTMTKSQYFTSIGLSAFAWLIGFVVPGAPGGLGIREAILCFFFTNTFSPETVVIGTILYRIVCMLGDLFAYIFSAIEVRPSGRNESQE